SNRGSVDKGRQLRSRSLTFCRRAYRMQGVAIPSVDDRHTAVVDAYTSHARPLARHWLAAASGVRNRQQKPLHDPTVALYATERVIAEWIVLDRQALSCNTTGNHETTSRISPHVGNRIRLVRRPHPQTGDKRRVHAIACHTALRALLQQQQLSR